MSGCNNCRGITLASVTEKILARISKKRIITKLDIRGDAQCDVFLLLILKFSVSGNAGFDICVKINK